MPRQFQGFVSRFSAGSRNAYVPDLVRLGLSADGAGALVDGGAISDLADRRRAAAIVAALLELTGPASAAELALVLTAGQPGGDALERARKLSELGLSLQGAYQVLFGDPVRDPEDRGQLAGLMRKSHRPGGNGYNGLTMSSLSGTQGYVKH